MNRSLRRNLLVVFMAFGLLAAACGTGDDASAPGAPLEGRDEPVGLAPDSDSGATPNAAGACLVGEPDCADTGAMGEPTDLPPPGDSSDDPVSPSGMLVDGGLSISEALASGAAGPIAIKGFLLITDQGARICEALAESYPPQCGGATITITGFEEVLSVPLSSAQGVSWTDEYASFLGEIIDGTFVVDASIAQ